MEHESFEDETLAKKLNKNFISIKVDKEERPDIDSAYMSVCQAMTGSGGWPLTIIISPDKKPFFAGTYFPKLSKYNMPGLMDILDEVVDQWINERIIIEDFANHVVKTIKKQTGKNESQTPLDGLVEKAYKIYKSSFDETYGGFGKEPKFPTPHNLLFLLSYHQKSKDHFSLQMVEKTLLQMYKGGIFDHIGYGFSRYSTDNKWLVPHFEKMLYDNALLILAYSNAFYLTQNELYKSVAEKTIHYIMRELKGEYGGFFCAQDADSDGDEGKYYTFTPQEIVDILGDTDGKKFNEYFDITQKGNFENKSIPNLINNTAVDDSTNKFVHESMNNCIQKIYNYRIKRVPLHKDDKILTSWNGLMISALANAFKIFGNELYIDAARKTEAFIEKNLSNAAVDSNKHTLYTSFRAGIHSNQGFIDDYAFFIWGLIELYRVTFEKAYLIKAEKYIKTCLANFWDEDKNGFFMCDKNTHELFMNPKETYDGAMPSGNSVMTYNLFMLSRILKSKELEKYSRKQNEFMARKSKEYPAGNGFFMYTLTLSDNKEIVCVLKDSSELNDIREKLDKNAIVTFLENATDEYPYKDDKTTFYVCYDNCCHAPVNDLHELQNI